MVSFLIAAFGLAFIYLLNRHVTPVNGPHYWFWPWGNIGFFRVAGYCTGPLCLYCTAIYYIDGTQRNLPPIILLILSNFLFQLMAISSGPFSYKMIHLIVSSPNATSYFTDALNIGDPLAWMRYFGLQPLSLHSHTHPPGPIIFYYVFIRLFGRYYGAYIGALVIGLLASLSIAMIWYLLSLLELDRRERLMICAYYSLIPGPILFFPEFDQVYPLFFLTMLYFWEKALRTGLLRYLFLFAVSMFVSFFFAYQLLTVGIVVVLLSMYFVRRSRDKRSALKRIMANGVLSICLFLCIHLVLYISTGHNSFIPFHRALENQAHATFDPPRPYYSTVLTDPYDFFLGAGYIALPILISFVWRRIGKFSVSDTRLAYSYIGLISIAILDFSGLLRCETARVWLFLQPLLIIPVGIELGYFKKWAQYFMLFLLFIIMISVKGNMWFIAGL